MDNKKIIQVLAIILVIYLALKTTGFLGALLPVGSACTNCVTQCPTTPGTNYCELIPIEHAMVSPVNPDTNYNNIIQIGSSTGANSKLSWLKFNGNLPSGTTIQSVELDFYTTTATICESGYETSQTTFRNIDGINTDWIGSTITWNNQPAYGGIIDGSGSVNDANSWRKSIGNLQSYLNGELQQNQFSLVFATPETAHCQIVIATTSSTTKPHLKISYTVPNPVSCSELRILAGDAITAWIADPVSANFNAALTAINRWAIC